MSDDPTNRESTLTSGSVNSALPAVEFDKQPIPLVRPNYLRITRTTPPNIAVEHFEDQKTVYEATRSASDDDLQTIFGDLLDPIHTVASFCLVSVAVNANHVAVDGIVAGYGTPKIISKTGASITHRQPCFSPGVQFCVSTGTTTISEIQDALVHALRPQSNCHFVGP
ncbi:hypothetical protein [Halosimplex amylolyticum]|uniref:hypothetical protein n=1 Tax=Halosimplex amylolyticum TaxID=3396616 RepID=UPI003F5556B9